MLFESALLFCPADRPDRYGKAAATEACVILDLEDAVAVNAKDGGRQSLIAKPLDASSTIVRVNSTGSGELEKDLEALRQTNYRTIMIPKAETPADIALVHQFNVIALCETPTGIRNAARLAAVGNVVALAWGSEDLIATIGGISSRHADGTYRDVVRYARSQVLLAASSEGKLAFDAAHLDMKDDVGLRRQVEDAAASGFAGALCVHPRQVDPIRQAFRPSRQSIAQAQTLLDAAMGAAHGAFSFDGRMIDEPAIRQARTLLKAASLDPPSTFAEQLCSESGDD
jgi:citrate lyase subunit beta/citryl-CoA lyase